MDKNRAKGKNTGQWLWLASAALLPVAIMAYLYRQNIAYVSQTLILLICGALLAFSVFAWLVIYLLFRSPVAAFAACLIGWIICFTANGIFTNIFKEIGIADHRLLILAAATLLLALLAAYLLRKVRQANMAGLCVLVFVVLLMMMNIVPVLTNNIKTTGKDDPQKYIKTEFVTEEHAERPNIYWFHCDGMLGFEAMEKYFGDAQEQFATQLTQRGFVFNRDARFESGHFTQIAIAELMCPYAYDNWIQPHASTHEAAMKLRDRANMRGIFLDYRLNNEMIAALDAGGYNTQTMVTGNQYFFPITDIFYYPAGLETARIKPDSNREQIKNSVERYEAQDFMNVVSKPLGIAFQFCYKIYEKGVLQGKTPNILACIYEFHGEYEIVKSSLTQADIYNVLLEGSRQGNSSDYYKSLVRSLDDSFKAEKPYFNVLWTGFAHYPFIADENGNIIASDDNMELSGYPAQHKYASKVLLNMVDMILEADPDAVIVLEADHGLHGNTEEDFTDAFGTADASIDMWNNVFSAIRVPEKYRNGEEHYALENPLNISRYLVNSFVGRNYKYIGEQAN